jgi:tyrosine phenol-lyase
VPIVQPPGGHAIYLDAAAFLPARAAAQFPGQSIVAELYLEGGVRAVEIGTVMFGRRDPATGIEVAAPMELVRLAIPRRVYTQSHIDYVIEVVLRVWERRESIGGYRITRQADVLRHFTAEFEPLYAFTASAPDDAPGVDEDLPAMAELAAAASG